MRALGMALVEALFLLVVAPVLLVVQLGALWLVDLVALLVPGRKRDDRPLASRAVSVVIPTWNGRELLEAYLPSVIEATLTDEANEVIVVDNASEDGTAEWLAAEHPRVRVLGLERNLGFGGGSNAGFEAARNDIVVLLNNDMRVERDYLEPLVDGFTDEQVFAVTAQIFFSDPNKRREETGLAVGHWVRGRLHLGHMADEKVSEIFPTFYAGGGSTAYDRRKFLELGGFDSLYAPFYMEDTDLSYQAWKRGWKVLYQPKSRVYHEHRGTIGKHFPTNYIDRTVHKNHLLFTWKNIHEPGRLAAHFGWTWASLWVRLVFGSSPIRPDSVALLRALRRMPRSLPARLTARRLSTVNDSEALRRPWGGYFRDRFGAIEADSERPSVLFVSPYSIEPPIHGGGVFMNQTVRHLANHTRLHLLCLVDEPAEVETNRVFEEVCETAELVVRWPHRSEGSTGLLPFAARHFYSPDLLWKIHRSIFVNRVDVLQIEYTQLAVYRVQFDRIATFLFEHDVYFQSVRRGFKGETSVALRRRRVLEYLRALRFERRALNDFDAIQVCTAVNRRYLESFAWGSPPIREGFRAGIDVERYQFVQQDREPRTLLFIGNFRHPPNRQALEFLVRDVFPLIRQKNPSVRLVAVGAQAPEGYAESLEAPGIEFIGEVDDIRESLSRYAVFMAPILTGSGVRVKLLEAFAAGIPVVSTRIGAEGLAETSGEIVELADTAEDFAAATLGLVEDPSGARDMATRARREVEQSWDMATITAKLAAHYREVLREKSVTAAPAGRQHDKQLPVQ